MSASNFWRLLLAIELAAGAAAAACWLPADAPRAAVIVLAALTPIIVQAAILGIEFIVGAVVDARRPRTSAWQVLRLWAREVRASAALLLWRIPFRTLPLPPMNADAAGPAVLLIHGYLCNRSVWQPLLDGGVLRDCRVGAVDLPLFDDIDTDAELVHKSVEALLADAPDAQVILLCHSMGGLAARAYLRRYGDARVARVITIDTPHQGTVFARLGHGTNARQMAVGSEFLTQLAASESAELKKKFVCVASRDDNLIVPRIGQTLVGARVHWNEAIGHNEAVEAAPVWQIVRSEILSAGHG